MLREDIRIPGHKFSCGAPASAKGNEHAIAKRAPPERPAINPFVEPSHALAKQACWSIALVVILACLFSALDNVVTLSNAHGTIAVQTWPRLFLAASDLAAGIVFDLAERRYMRLVMLGIAVLSTSSILAVEAGADPNLGLVVFYLSSDFFVTFFTATFTQLAPRMHAPALWAGMGRAANNACAFTTSGVSLALVTSGNVALIMIGALMLLVAASVAFVAAGLFRLPQTKQEREHQQRAEEAWRHRASRSSAELSSPTTLSLRAKSTCSWQ